MSAKFNTRRKFMLGFMFFKVQKVSSPVKYLGIMHSKSYNSLCLAWSTEKGDWWYDKDPSNAKFFRIETKRKKDYAQRGIYIGRYAFVIMQNRKVD